MDLRVQTALKSIAENYLSGRTSPIEAAVELAPFQHDVPLELREHLIDMVAVSSECDAIPFGPRRE